MQNTYSPKQQVISVNTGSDQFTDSLWKTCRPDQLFQQDQQTKPALTPSPKTHVHPAADSQAIYFHTAATMSTVSITRDLEPYLDSLRLYLERDGTAPLRLDARNQTPREGACQKLGESSSPDNQAANGVKSSSGVVVVKKE